MQNRGIILTSKMTGSVQKYRDLCETRAAIPSSARPKSISPSKHRVTGIGKMLKSLCIVYIEWKRYIK
jgi:hypothetical protein